MEIKKAWFICSYGGEIKIQGCNELTYVGGTNKLVSVDRRIDFAGMLADICGCCRLDCNGYNFEYKLPDSNSLVPVTNDSDLHDMMLLFDRLYRVDPAHYPIRLFLFPNPKDVKRTTWNFWNFFLEFQGGKLFLTRHET
ncbi:hypothetical protein PIB30_090729 [Stylosanthes scabra]|uniref:PB1 domain-containing protein n=1 Tax=Stylosanthes scabra TaxID=79078 RepID=A0ABU6ZSZ9_9FABA|nr:hypothetical protein [Stylosanthes scabra]